MGKLWNFFILQFPKFGINLESQFPNFGINLESVIPKFGMNLGIWIFFCLFAVVILN